MNIDEWKAKCASLGIAGIPLAAAAADARARIA
jgi:hypothetical protein